MFASSQRGITVTDFALPPETTKKQIKYEISVFKILDIRQKTLVISKI